MLGVFKLILLNSSILDEQSSTLKCIWHLCFDERICEILQKDKEFISLIANVKTVANIDEMERKASGILFTLNEFHKKMPTTGGGGTLNGVGGGRVKVLPTSSDKPILISFQGASRDICLRIRDELKMRGYPVRSDVDQIYGSTLSSMCEAVEASSVILMCVSEKYYQSASCRLEAELAVKLHKPVIPLVMQSEYMPIGWLGSIIGGKIFYKFIGTKLSFEHTFSNTLKEINRYILIEEKTHVNRNSTHSSNHSNRKYAITGKNSNRAAASTAALNTNNTTLTSLNSEQHHHRHSHNQLNSNYTNMYSNNTANDISKNYFNNTDKTIQFEIIRKTCEES